MNHRLIGMVFATLATSLLCASTAHTAVDEDDDAPVAQGTPTLNREQRDAVGIVVARAVKAEPAERIAAFGQVLDPTSLITDLGDAESNRAAERAASAEVARLQGLYKAGAGASLKNLQTAQAEQARAAAQARSATSRFDLRWASLAARPSAERQKIIDAVAGGDSILVRVDLPGQYSIGTVPEKALLDVDGIAVAGRVLGVSKLGDAQSASLLVEVEHAPAGLGPGARVPVALDGAKRSGFLVPRGALVYEEGGTYVYHQLDAKAGDENTQYARKKITPLMPSGDGWLVDGLDDDDLIVVHGTGVLWSLEGIGSMPAEDDD